MRCSVKGMRWKWDRGSFFLAGTLGLVLLMLVLELRRVVYPEEAIDEQGEVPLRVRRSSRGESNNEAERGLPRYRRVAPHGVRLVSRELVGEGWREVLERIPTRYAGTQMRLVDIEGGGGEIEAMVKRQDFFFAVDLVAANYGLKDETRAVFSDWLKGYRARLCDTEVVQNRVGFEDEGKQIYIISADHLYEVLLPERWIQGAEVEFLNDFDVSSGVNWDAEALTRGGAWLKGLGLKGEARAVRLGLTAEQWEEMEGRRLSEGVSYLREDQLFRLGWMAPKFKELLLDGETE